MPTSARHAEPRRGRGRRWGATLAGRATLAGLALGAAPPSAVVAAESQIRFEGELLIALDQPLDAPLPELEAAPGVEAAARTPRLAPLFELEVRGEGPQAATVQPGDEPAAPSSRRLWIELPRDASLAAAEATPQHPWDAAHRLVDGQPPSGYAETFEALRAAAPEGARIAAVEPDFFTTRKRFPRGWSRALASACRPECRSRTAGSELTICRGPSRHWPAGDQLAWHLEPEFSQLRRARALAYGPPPPPGSEPPAEERREDVLIAHLDTGYDPRQVLLPRAFDAAGSRDFTAGPEPIAGGEDPCLGGPFKNPGHGTATLAILAGNRVQLNGTPPEPFDDHLGGAPLTTVVAYRISDSVVHFKPSRMAAAIAYAASSGVDVVSMSMGGLPSAALRDAVNKAYESGTALFTAAGNFLKIPVLPISTPRSLVYPARFDRVVAVTGATADGRAYARSPGLGSLVRGGFWRWAMRGSYGPPEAMEEALAAFTPNVAWARPSSLEPSNLVVLDGAGTSAATPQAAAAAALWIEKQRDALATLEPPWRRAEAVYRAVLETAAPSHLGEDYTRRYFGRGLLRAADAMSVPVPAASELEPRPPARIGFDWVAFLLTLETAAPATAPDALLPDRDALHRQMIATEVAQLVHDSRELERILARFATEDGRDDPRLRRRFLRALRREPHCSAYLRAALERSGY